MDTLAEYLAITLLRHGLTAENERHAYIGWSDVSLSKKGRELLGKYKDFQDNYELFLCSDRKRCVETAEILFPNNSLKKCSAFREMNFGEWERKTYDELKNNELYRKWLDDFYKVCPPGGEDFYHFTKRIDEGWRKLLTYLFTNDLRKVVIVSHGGVIRYLLSKLAPEKAEFWDWRIPHGGGYELIWTEQEGKGEIRCTLLREVTLTEKPHGSGIYTD